MNETAPLRLTDSHAHLGFEGLLAELPAVLDRAAEAGVHRVMTISSQLGDEEQVLALAAAHPRVWAAVGVHPHEAKDCGAAQLDAIRAQASHPKLLAVGEMGLDYHYDHSPRERQQEVFRSQIRLAREIEKPIVVHSRDAEEDTARILAEEEAGSLGGILHCFTSSRSLAERCLEMGFLISFSGIVTFPSARELQELAAELPLDRLLVETDAPYLSPVPHRGQWPNEPARVRATAEFLAGLRGIEPAALAAATEANFERLFPATAA